MRAKKYFFLLHEQLRHGLLVLIGYETLHREIACSTMSTNYLQTRHVATSGWFFKAKPKFSAAMLNFDIMHLESHSLHKRF